MAIRRRILVAVEPPLLGDTLARILRQTGLADVVVIDVDAVIVAADDRFDAAVVTLDAPADVAADVVIHLPGRLGDGGVATIQTSDRTSEHTISDVGTLLRVLEHVHPAASPEVDVLHLDR